MPTNGVAKHPIWFMNRLQASHQRHHLLLLSFSRLSRESMAPPDSWPLPWTLATSARVTSEEVVPPRHSSHRTVATLFLGSRQALPRPRLRQIGSASCMERLWPYV